MLIAVAGGICTGKSEVVEILRNLGAVVIKMDDVNRELLKESDYIEKIRNIFPNVIKNGGEVDKKLLRKIVFDDENARKKLNELSHPIIMDRVQKMAEAYGGLVFIENPLLVESRTVHEFDSVWVVTATNATRIKRLVNRDKISAQEAEKIINAQVKEETAAEYADELIDNDGTREELKEKVEALYYTIDV